MQQTARPKRRRAAWYAGRVLVSARMHSPAPTLLLAALVLLAALPGCKSLVWDPTRDIGNSEGHRVGPRGGIDVRDLPEDRGIPLDDGTSATAPDRVRPGTGTFVRRLSPPPVNAGVGDVTLNFDNTDIREVVKVILGDLLGANYVIDPSVSGSASLSTGRPLRREHLLPTLETLLRMNGLALVERGGGYEVLPAAAAVAGAVTPQLGTSTAALPEGYSVQVVPLRFVGAEEMANILTPLAPEGSVVRVDTLRNLLVLAGNSPDMSNLLDTIGVFDVDWMAGLSVGFFTLEFAKAADVVAQLEALLADEGGGSPMKGLFRFIPMETANALLVVSPQQSYLNQMEDWIRRLDMAEGSGGTAPRLFVYRVRHGSAADLAGMLGDLFGGGGGGSRRSVGGVAPGLREAAIGGGEAGAAGNLGGTGGQGVGSTLDMSTEVNVVADKVNNSLLVRASPKDYRRILEALKQLDIAPLQVLIEATIVEISLVGDLRYGVQWRFFGPAAGDYRGDTSLRQNADGPGLTFPGFNWSVVLRPNTIRATLSALASDQLINVLSSPSVMVINNEKARIQVGERVAVIASQQGTGGTGTIITPNNNLFQDTNLNNNQATTINPNVIANYQYQDTGVILEVTPRVTPGGMVQMEIKQEVSEQTPGAGVSGQPNFRTRNIESIVAVRSNQAVVLGGLIRDRSEGGKSGVPGLYRAPLIGPLFGETKRNAARTELVVVLTPRVIASDADIETVNNDFRRKVQNLDTRF